MDIAGTAELVADPEKALPRRLSHKYLGADAPAGPDAVRRLIVRVRPCTVTGFSA